MKTHVSWMLFALLLVAGGHALGQQVSGTNQNAPAVQVQHQGASAMVSQPVNPAADPKLYYNPFSEKLYIEQKFHTTTRVSIRMVDANGRTVYEMKDKLVYPGLNKMVVSLLESLPGAYFVHINAGNREYVRTLVTMP